VSRPGNGPSLDSPLPSFGLGAGVPYGCDMREAHMGDGDPIRNCLISNARHIGVGVPIRSRRLVCIPVTERKSAF
jgi:hypothetical protein